MFGKISEWPPELCERVLNYCDLALACYESMSGMSVVEENDHFSWVCFGLPSPLAAFYELPSGLQVPSIWIPLEHDPSRGYLLDLSHLGCMDSTVYSLFNSDVPQLPVDKLIRAASDAYELSSSLVFTRPSRPPSFDFVALRGELQDFSEKICLHFSLLPAKMKEQRVEPPRWRPDFYR